jgi:hypothetical protein
MIQGTTETTFKAYISTEDNRIDTSVSSLQIRHLFKITNEMSNEIVYCYPTETINARYTEFTFTYAQNPDMFAGELDLKPSGHYTYEIYEVAWSKAGPITTTSNNSPQNETDVLPVSASNGIVKGIVTKGLLYMDDKAGTGQVQYTQHTQPAENNYIWYGGTGFTNAFSLEFDGVDDYVDCGDAPIFTINHSAANRGFSVSLWLKLTSGNTTEQVILNKSDFFSAGGFRYEYQLRADFQSKPRFIIYGGDSSAIFQQLIIDTPMEADKWYHIGFTYNLGSDSSSIIGYLNGEQATASSGGTYTSGGVWTAPVNTVAPLFFARVANAYGLIKLDEVALFDDNLSGGKMISYYNNGKPTSLANEDHIVGYWRNGDPNGTSSFPTIDDVTSFNNDGTMTNMINTDIITDAP